MVKDPSLLSPVYKIKFDPSPRAQEILKLCSDAPDSNEPPVVPTGSPTSTESPFPFPTLSSALKEEVLRGVATRRKLFPPKKKALATSNSSSQVTSPRNPIPASVSASVPKDVPTASSQPVFSGNAMARGGSTAVGPCLDLEKEKFDDSL